MRINKTASSIEEVIKEYRKQLKKISNDPGLHIGYGNILRSLGKLNEAELHYREAFRLEPKAVEALTQLGEIEEMRGNIHSARDFYAKALQGMPDAIYFKIPNVEEFKNIVVEKHYSLEKRTRGETGVNLIEDVILVEPQKKKVGRNDPCPCGSSKKYKKCCLAKDEAAGRKTAVTPVESSLTERLVSFSKQQHFGKEFEDAYSLFFKKQFTEPIAMDDEQEMAFGAFLEWFIHDRILKSGKTIVEEFYQENFRRLSQEERNIIEAEMLGYLSVYEVAAIVPDEGVRLRDLTTGEEIEVKDVSGSRNLVKWDIVITRVIRLEAANKLSGFVTLLSRNDKEQFMLTLSAKREEFKTETGKGEWNAFMKIRGHLLFQIHREQTISTPVFFTGERHHTIGAEAEFDSPAFQDVRRLLSNEFDFVLDEEKEKKELRYTWLKRGKSKDWEEGKLSDDKNIRPIVLQSEMVASSTGDLRFTVLGNIKATPKRIILECISKERLERGKSRLKEIFGNTLRHRQDIFKDFEKYNEKLKGASKKIKKGLDSKKEIALMTHYYSRFVDEWPNSSIPALNGMAPVEACKTEAGRLKVEELLKDMENHEERKRKDGLPYLDVNKIKERLDIGTKTGRNKNK